MERDRQIAKLVNVLQRVARGANYVAVRGSDPEAAGFCAAQYNRVLARLTELEPAVARTFVPLALDSSAEVTRIAARELSAYFEDEAGHAAGRHRMGHCGGVGARVFAVRFPTSRRCG
jgi:hypothetical protein